MKICTHATQTFIINSSFYIYICGNLFIEFLDKQNFVIALLYICQTIVSVPYKRIKLPELWKSKHSDFQMSFAKINK